MQGNTHLHSRYRPSHHCLNGEVYRGNRHTCTGMWVLQYLFGTPVHGVPYAYQVPGTCTIIVESLCNFHPSCACFPFVGTKPARTPPHASWRGQTSQFGSLGIEELSKVELVNTGELRGRTANMVSCLSHIINRLFLRSLKPTATARSRQPPKQKSVPRHGIEP
jgi:hypothetical protein